MTLELGRLGIRASFLRFLVLIALFFFVSNAALPAQSYDSDAAVVAAPSGDGVSDPDDGAVAAAAADLPDAPSHDKQPEESSSRPTVNALAPFTSPVIQPPKSDKFNLKGAFIQTFNENLFFHIWRVAFDPGLRYNVAHKPFWHDYGASFKGYDMSNWGDGDDFVVNDVGHPLEGAVFGRSLPPSTAPAVMW